MRYSEVTAHLEHPVEEAIEAGGRQVEHARDDIGLVDNRASIERHDIGKNDRIGQPMMGVEPRPHGVRDRMHATESLLEGRGTHGGGGEHVRASQPLLYVASPDYSQLRSAYIKARDAFQLADRFYKRAQDLLAHKAIAQADLEQAESNRAQAEADLQSSEQAIRVLGVSNPESLVTSPPSPELPLLAPLAGEIVERLCSPGQLLQAGATQCFTLSDMSNVWVLVNIYQKDVAYVHVGDEVTIDNEAYPGVVRGKIQYIAPALDPTTRTLPARVESSNPGERLKKDMYVTALVRAGVIPNALVVPDSAVLRDTENMPYVYLQTGNNQFARRMVTLGESQGGKTQIQSGLQVGDKIVGDGSLFLQFQNSLQR